VGRHPRRGRAGRGAQGGRAALSEAPAVRVEGLVKRFGAFTAVDGLDFRVERGEIFGLLGPNGSGKTTTVNVISGLSAPTAGTVAIFGVDPLRQAQAARRLLGVVPQETALYDELTAERNLRFHAELFGIPARERGSRIAAMLELAQLTERARSRVGTFSGGMKRRLAIARALLHQPSLVYLDEPTLGVDVQARRAIWDYILAMKAEGRTVLLTTNYLEEGEQLCDRMAILDHGRVVALDTPRALKARFGSSVLDLELDAAPPAGLADALRALPGVQEVTADGERVLVTLAAATPVPQILAEVARLGGALRHLNLREPSLDEVFLSLTGRGLRD
jgi:ABC-2 type transport system ATP-binding protein